MNNQNFFRVEKESDIDELFAKNPYKLFALLFSVNNPNFNKNVYNDCVLIKKNIKNKYKEEENIIFIFVDLQNYKINDNKYSKQITKDSLPLITFYFNNQPLARILNTEVEALDNTIEQLKEKLKEHFQLAKKDNKEEEVNNLKEQIREQRKIEEIEKLKQENLINELTKLKKAKEIEEQMSDE